MADMGISENIGMNVWAGSENTRTSLEKAVQGVLLRWERVGLSNSQDWESASL